MPDSVYLPTDDFNGRAPNDNDVAADFLELSAFFAQEKFALTQSIVDALELAADDDFRSVEEEIERREEVATAASTVISDRMRALAEAYPFSISEDGRVISCELGALNYGQAAYLISLILSNLDTITPLLNGSEMHPTDAEVRLLRQYFQYFATAALAAEIGGQAWSFGFPRPDHSGFLSKLRDVWAVLKDGIVDPEEGEVPLAPKDDGVDIFAGRLHADGLPGFLFAVAQVATGADWPTKSIRNHLNGVFFQRWFGRQPSTPPLPYHIIPFALPRRGFRNHVRTLGNVLHRLRVPLRVEQARELHAQGVLIEAYDQLDGALAWVSEYASREPVS
ncbi:MAG: hypothetical protein OXF56_12975 [Rhodobacteraceae bacterium]|nr:hypothetical protein [Paracoccaceae bacterium]